MRLLLVAFLALAIGCGSGDREAQPITVSPPASSTPSSGHEGAASATEDPLTVGTDPCTTDADCAPSVCCHAPSCVARASAPTCTDAVCTQECRGGTIDCGGACLCHQGRCAARLMAPLDVAAPQ